MSIQLNLDLNESKSSNMELDLHGEWKLKGDVVTYYNLWSGHTATYTLEGIESAIETVKKSRDWYLTEKAYNNQISFLEHGRGLLISHLAAKGEIDINERIRHTISELISQISKIGSKK